MTNSGLSDKCGAISKQEWLFVWGVIVTVLVVTSLPYLYGYLSSPPDRQYMGLMLDVPDHGQYLSWWRSFQSGFLARNKLTPEPNDALFFNLLWWSMAQVSRWTGLAYAPLYQIFRWVAGGLFLWATYRLIAQFLLGVRQRRMAFLLVTLGSGLGWVLVVLKYALPRGRLYFPLDVYIAEGNSFLCILGYPHFSFAAAFIALIFERIWRGWKTGRARHMVIAGLLALLLGWMHAYDLLLVYGIAGIFGLLVWWKEKSFPWQLFRGGLIIFGLSCSGGVYSVLLTTLDPLWEKVLAQFANAGVYTPTPLHLLILMGVPLILAIVASIRLVLGRKWNQEDLFVFGWFAAGACLNYIPTDFQIHMLNSWQIPIAILAAKGVDSIVPLVAQKIGVARLRSKLGGKEWRLLLTMLVLVVLPTNAYLWAWRFVDLARHDYPYYLDRDDVAALNWLLEHTDPEEVVLSSLTIGQYVPALGGNTAFLAHWAQTVDFYEKRRLVESFYNSLTLDKIREEIVHIFGIDYVLYGPAERALGDYDPTTTPWLRLVFSTPRVNVYAVQTE